MLEYLLISLAGLAGSMHCVGMCGGFACILGRDRRGRAATLARHLTYNLGRVTTYCFLGAAAGALGVMMSGGVTGLAQRTLAAGSGLLMLYFGLQFLGLWRDAARSVPGPGGEALAGALRQLVRAPGVGAPLALGALNGFLPCPLVYAFLAQAVASGGSLPGVLVMAAFGLGTFPAMLAMGGVGLWLRRGAERGGVVVVSASAGALLARPDWRQMSVRIAGGFIVLLGVITLARGVLPMDAHLHGL